jgi:hypothetical protein
MQYQNLSKYFQDIHELCYMRNSIFKTKLLFDVNEFQKKEIRCVYIGSSDSLKNINNNSHQQQIYIQLPLENIIIVEKGIEIIYNFKNNEKVIYAFIYNHYTEYISNKIVKIIEISNCINRIIQEDMNNEMINRQIERSYNEYYNRTINDNDNQIYVYIQTFSISAKLYPLDCIN